MKTVFILISSLWILGIISCKKDDDVSPGVKDHLTAHTWKATGLLKDGVSQANWCWHNFLYNFIPDGKLFTETVSNPGGCLGPPSGTIYKFSWSLSADEKWLVINEGVPPTEMDSFQIISISATELKTKRVVGKSSPPTITWEDTFTPVP